MRWFARVQEDRVLDVEGAAARAANGLSCVSVRDAEALRAFGGRAVPLVVPNGVDLVRHAFRRESPRGETVLFIGDLSWPPNADGVRWLVSQRLAARSVAPARRPARDRRAIGARGPRPRRRSRRRVRRRGRRRARVLARSRGGRRAAPLRRRHPTEDPRSRGHRRAGRFDAGRRRRPRLQPTRPRSCAATTPSPSRTPWSRAPRRPRLPRRGRPRRRAPVSRRNMAGARSAKRSRGRSRAARRAR